MINVPNKKKPRAGRREAKAVSTKTNGGINSTTAPATQSVARTGAPMTFLRKMFGDRTRDNIFLCSYANIRGEFPARNSVISISQPDLAARIEAFLQEFDVPGRAIYIGVNPVRGHRKGKAQIATINALHTELDFKGIVEDRKSILGVLRRLKYRPSVVVFSGHGLHCYWIFDKPLGAERIASHEKMLKRVTMVLAGDKSAAEAARVLRLPGSHNSKFKGEWLTVEVIKKLTNWKTHRVEDLDEWLTATEPLLHYKPKPNAKGEANAKPLNIWQQFGRETRAESGGFDIEQRLADMQYGGVHKNGINDTYTAIVGGMVRVGETLDDVLQTLLAPHNWCTSATVAPEKARGTRGGRSAISGSYTTAFGKKTNWK